MGCEGETLAEGVRILHPLRGDTILNLVLEYDGELISVEEEKILLGWRKLAESGFYTEPTSAIVWNALEQQINRLPEPIILVLTGSGLKSNLEVNYGKKLE
jgi:threonine synthase